MTTPTRSSQRTSRSGPESPSINREEVLVQIADEIFSAEQQQQRLYAISTSPLDLDALSDFDDSIPGPSLRRLDAAVRQQLRFSSPGRDLLSIGDRDVFRPLQYCATAFEAEDGLEWRTREVVQKSGLHLEALINRMGPFKRLPLGIGVRRLEKRLGPLSSPLRRFVALHNDAKHLFDHELGTHMFSVRDAVLAYVISRALGLALYPHARLQSDWDFIDEPESLGGMR